MAQEWVEGPSWPDGQVGEFIIDWHKHVVAVALDNKMALTG